MKVRITILQFLARNFYNDKIVTWSIGVVSKQVFSVSFLRTLCQCALCCHVTALKLITSVLRFIDLVLWITLSVLCISITP